MTRRRILTAIWAAAVAGTLLACSGIPVAATSSAASVHPRAPKSGHNLPLLRISRGGIEPIYDPRPRYPSLAREHNIQGTVRLEVFIGSNGRVESLRIISGHPLLREAALEAVSHWRFRPVRWNQKPARAVTEIDIPFRLKPQRQLGKSPVA
jgi:protein TonB